MSGIKKSGLDKIIIRDALACSTLAVHGDYRSWIAKADFRIITALVITDRC